MGITERIADVVRPAAASFVRSVGDRVYEASGRINPPGRAPESSAAAFTGAAPTSVISDVDISDARSPEDLDLLSRTHAFLERTAPSALAGGVQQALSSGIYRNDASPRKGSDDLVQLYNDSPWLRATAHKVGSGVAAVEWRLFARKAPGTKGNPDGPRDYVSAPELVGMFGPRRQVAVQRALSEGDLEEFPVHPFHRLMDRPNPSMNGFASRLVTCIHLDLLGEAFWVVDVDGAGRPCRFWPIPSQWVKTIPTVDKPYFEVDFPNYHGLVPADRMMWFRDVSPGDPYARGAGLGMALADELDIDEHAAKTVKGYFENQAIPPLLVSLKGARQDVVDRARRTWEKTLKGFRHAYQTFFTGAEISVERLDTSFKEMALVDLRKSVRDAVVQTWGLPPEKLAIIENSNRSTIEAADLIYTKEVLVPRLELIRLELQRIVMWWDPRLIVEYVSPVPEDTERRRAVVTATPTIFTIDEQRALAELPPLPNNQGAAFLVDSSRIYTRTLESLAQGTPVYSYHLSAGVLTNNEMRDKLGLPPTNEPWGNERTVGFYSPFMGGSGGTAIGDDEVDGVDIAAEQDAERPDETTPDDVDLTDPAAVDAATEARARSAVPSFADVKRITALAARQSAALARKQRGRQRSDSERAKKTSALTVKNLRAVLASIDVNSMAGNLEPVIASLVEKFGQETIEAIEATKRFDMQDPEVVDFIREQLQDRVGRLMNVTTRDNLRSTITEWDGDDDDALVDDVRGVFDSARIERSQSIAETEGQRSREFAAHQAMRQSGIVERKEWVAVGDGRTREAHLAMDGQMRDINAPFEVPSGKWAGAKAQVPGSFGIASLDIRCRCQSAPVFDLDEDVPDTDRAARRTELLAAGIVVRGASPDERAELWRAQDTKLRKFETRLADAASAGFDEQEAAVLKALRKVLG